MHLLLKIISYLLKEIKLKENAMELTFSLNNNTKERFTRFVKLYEGNLNRFVNELIDFRISELKKGIRNIEIDFLKYEKKYNLSSNKFYEKYLKGEYDDENNDFIIWSGEYEAYNDFQNELKQLL